MLKTFALAALIATSTVAGATDTVPNYSVKTSDLDLTTEAGIARLDARVEYAAKAMCSSGRRDVASQRIEAECRSDVIDSNRRMVQLAIAKAKADKVRFAATAANPQPGV